MKKYQATVNIGYFGPKSYSTVVEGHNLIEAKEAATRYGRNLALSLGGYFKGATVKYIRPALCSSAGQIKRC